MEVKLEELIAAEMYKLFQAVEAIGIDAEVFKAHSESCVMGYGFEEYGEGFELHGAASRGVTWAEELGRPSDEVEGYKNSFNYLCSLSLVAPRNVIALLGMSYWTLIRIEEGQEGYATPHEKVEGLIHASHGLGKAIGISEKIELQQANIARKVSLSKAGEIGAAMKNAGTKRLKSWAIETAKGMRGSDMDISRKLSAQLPQHLADVSKDPQRLIYDALRKR